MKQVLALMPRKIITWIVLSMALLVCEFPVQAAEETPAPAISPEAPSAAMFPPSDWTRETTYADKISHKLGFGFLNIAAGWTAFFYEPCKNGNFFANLGKGVLFLTTNTVGGVLHAATFPVPVDIPLPYGGIVHEYEK